MQFHSLKSTAFTYKVMTVLNSEPTTTYFKTPPSMSVVPNQGSTDTLRVRDKVASMSALKIDRIIYYWLVNYKKLEVRKLDIFLKAVVSMNLFVCFDEFICLF